MNKTKLGVMAVLGVFCCGIVSWRWRKVPGRHRLFSFKSSPEVGVAILFLITGSFVAPKAWEYWINESMFVRDDYLRPTFKFYLHVSNGSEYFNIRKSLPKMLQKSIMPKSRMTTCSWGRTTPCGRALLQYAYEEEINQFFFWVSGTTIPVKTPQYIWDLIKYSRTRVCYSGTVYPFPKQSQWAILRRDFVEKMLRYNFEKMGDLTFYNGTRATFGADDEIAPTLALYLHEGYEAIDNIVNDGTPNWKNKIEYCNTKVFWDNSHPIGQILKIGHVVPYLYDYVYSRRFEAVVGESWIWFIRKFSQNCTVDYFGYDDERRVELQDYLIQYLTNLSAHATTSTHATTYTHATTLTISAT